MKTKKDVIDLLESLDFLSKNKKEKYISQLDDFDDEALKNLYDFFYTKQEEYFSKLNIIINKHKGKQEKIILGTKVAELKKKEKEETEQELDKIRKQIEDN